jgi:hypothetical protein
VRSTLRKAEKQKSRKEERQRDGEIERKTIERKKGAQHSVICSFE